MRNTSFIYISKLMNLFQSSVLFQGKYSQQSQKCSKQLQKIRPDSSFILFLNAKTPKEEVKAVKLQSV